MPKSVASLLIVVILTVCSTVAYSRFHNKTIDIVYETEIYVERGDCFENLIAPYYDRCTNGATWEDYRYEQKQLNKKLFENGRVLQVRDIVKVQWYVRRKLAKNV